MKYRQALSVAALAATFAAITIVPALAADVTLNETGSSLLYPLFKIWSTQYGQADPHLRIVAGSTGSGAGIAQAVAGTVQIGASDAYMSDAEMKQNPNIVNVPLAISAQTVNFNIPGLNRSSLRLDGPTLAGIYSGTIRYWDADEITALNPGLRLPHNAIVPIRRSDSSGDSFIFSQFLSFSTPAWESAQGFGTEIVWPSVPGELTAVGNRGMIETAKRTPYSVAYIGVSLFREIAAAGLGTAQLKNQAGNFVLPTAATVGAAAAVLGPRTPADERLSLVFAPGADSYPLVNYEYAIVSTKQPDAATAAAMRSFLLWTVEQCSGNSPKTLSAVRFIPLPEYIRALSDAQLEKIH